MYRETLLLSQFTDDYNHLLQESCRPTQPTELRVAVAREIEALWLLNSPAGGNRSPACFVALVLELLQDTDQDVRHQAACSLGCILRRTQCNTLPCCKCIHLLFTMYVEAAVDAATIYTLCGGYCNVYTITSTCIHHNST